MRISSLEKEEPANKRGENASRFVVSPFDQHVKRTRKEG